MYRWLKPKLMWKEIPSPRHSMISWTSVDKQFMFIFGGVLDCYDNVFEEQAVYRFDTVSREWERIETSGDAPPLECRNNLMVYSGTNDCVYVLEVKWVDSINVGYITGNPAKTPESVVLYKLDLSVWTWTKGDCTVEGYPRPSFIGCSLCSYKKYLIIYGGLDSDGSISSCSYFLDIESRRCAQFKPTGTHFPSYRYLHNAIVSNASMYLYGGRNISSKYRITQYTSNYLHHLKLDSTVVIDPSPNQWDWREIKAFNTGAMDMPREDFAMIAEQESIIFFGGKSLKVTEPPLLQELNDVAIMNIINYNGTLNKLAVNQTHAPSPRSKSTMQCINGNLYVFGGESSKVLCNDLYVLKMDPKYQDRKASQTFQDTLNKMGDISDSESDEYEDTEDESESLEDEELIKVLKHNFSIEEAVDNKNYFPDIQFKIGNTSIYAHKIICYNASSVFQKMFSSKGERESKKNEDASEYSTWENELSTEIIKLPDNWNIPNFKRLLKYLYSGKLEVISQEEAKQFSEMAFELLIDPVMKFCETQTYFPSIFSVPPDEKCIELKKQVGKKIGSDISFVFQKKKQLLAHKLILVAHSDYYRQHLLKNRNLKYIEVNDIDEKQFIEYLIMIYTNFNPNIKTKLDSESLFDLSLKHKNIKIIKKLFDENKVNLMSLAKAIEFSKSHNKELYNICTSYFEENFDDCVRRSEIVKRWPKRFLSCVKKWLDETEEFGISSCNWLDRLWFAHHTNDEKLMLRSLQKLDNLIGVDNVIQVLFCVHTIYTNTKCNDAKLLRSKCVNYLIENALFVKNYQTKKNLSTLEDKSKITNLSESLKMEVQSVLKNTVMERKYINNSTSTSFFKQRNCDLCNDTMELIDVQKDTQLPPVFGLKIQPQQLCNTCCALVTLVEKLWYN